MFFLKKERSKYWNTQILQWYVVFRPFKVSYWTLAVKALKKFIKVLNSMLIFLLNTKELKFTETAKKS